MNTKASLCAALFLGAAIAARAGQPVELGAPEVIHHRPNPRYGNAPTKGSTGATTPLLFHGGPVMQGPVNAHVIWYGNWDQNNPYDTRAGQQIVRDFLSSIGDSPYFLINTTYGSLVDGSVAFAGEVTDSYSQGKKLSDQKIASIVRAAAGAHPDPNGVYFVLTSTDVTVTSGFCTRYCGWHTHGQMSGTDVKYSFVGNAGRCLNACAAQAVGPNGNAGVDAMISVIAHELEEAVTDPDLNAWYDASGAENADKCAWTFGQNQQVDSKGAYYNMTLGARNYLIQRNLIKSTDDKWYCAVSYNANGSFSQ